ncbi:hypothetical protein BWQ96_04909 [Gracilariopsis chorda]|uniref:Uncharacterized protein n=1 Tax=Gracilariopsis chorda TaxID=448386 RepID=A0A2V3IT91_9FLOR|nr:hypothetical protein BWQ96_04909 [Gracilariopsis chorda]|eukprot:PXF45319.1 hypothetical protein BWQ96_04909 [Gracilariopsis chorda]
MERKPFGSESATARCCSRQGALLRKLEDTRAPGMDLEQKETTKATPENVKPGAGPAAFVTVGSPPPSLGEQAQIVPLEEQFLNMQAAHNAIVGELTSLGETVESYPVQGMGDEIRLLRSDINYMLDYFGIPAPFVEVIEKRFDRVRIRLESVEKAVYTSAAAAVKPVVSERAVRPDVQANCKSWKHW